MAPVVLIALLGASAFALSKLKPGSVTQVGGNIPASAIKTVAGTVPTFTNPTPVNRATVNGPSGLIYSTVTHNPVNGGILVTIQLIGGQTAAGGASQVSAPNSWLMFTQNQATGLRSNIQRGTVVPPQMLADFAIN